MRRLTLGSRGSALALAQARAVQAALVGLHEDIGVDIAVIKTSGDRLLDSPLSVIGGKGLFVREIETALEARRGDDLAAGAPADHRHGDASLRTRRAGSAGRRGGRMPDPSRMPQQTGGGSFLDRRVSDGPRRKQKDRLGIVWPQRQGDRSRGRAGRGAAAPRGRGATDGLQRRVLIRLSRAGKGWLPWSEPDREPRGC